ncbi:hypothetical protein BKA81DRAFT_352529 [Phyllosticta paracitricarpa]
MVPLASPPTPYRREHKPLLSSIACNSHFVALSYDCDPYHPRHSSIRHAKLASLMILALPPQALVPVHVSVAARVTSLYIHHYIGDLQRHAKDFWAKTLKPLTDRLEHGARQGWNASLFSFFSPWNRDLNDQRHPGADRLETMDVDTGTLTLAMLGSGRLQTTMAAFVCF